MGGRATQVAERLLQLAGQNPDEYSSGLDEFNAKDVAVGVASFGVEGGGSFTPVTCVLEAQPDVHDSGSHPFNWDAMFDNPSNFGALGAIPVGLGLTFAFDGSDNTVATTEAGTWAFTLGFFVADDATWTGSLTLDSGLYAQQTILPVASLQGPGSLSEVVTVPAGWSITPTVTTNSQATADPYLCDCYLNIVRLA